LEKKHGILTPVDFSLGTGIKKTHRVKPAFPLTAAQDSVLS